MAGPVAGGRPAAGQFHPAQGDRRDPEITRYRKKLIQSRTSELQRLGKVLQDAGVKIDSVASSLSTKSARDMIEALIGGQRDPRVLADLARGVMRSKIPDLSMALAGRFGDHHAVLARLHLDMIDHLEQMIARLDGQVEAMTVPFCAQIQGLCTIPGIAERTAQVIISEIGVDMSRFPISIESYSVTSQRQPARPVWSPRSGRANDLVPRCPGEHAFQASGYSERIDPERRLA